jgi:methyl-accepting chemotaxis protein
MAGKTYSDGEPAQGQGTSEDLKSRVSKLESALEAAPMPMMTMDDDFVIIDANKASFDLLRKYEPELKALYPGLRLEELVGSCIDVFHKNPAYQRALLADSSNLPWKSVIDVGALKFEINVSRVTDAKGKPDGFFLCWQDVTAQRAKEEEAKKLQEAVETASTAMMSVNKDFVVDYANAQTFKLLNSHSETLRAMYPGFDPQKLVGTCIDVFHKVPSHQRGVLNNQANLPFSTTIAVGSLHFDINVTGVKNAAGELEGWFLCWEDVTEKKAKEEESARLQTALDNAGTPVMMVDNDFVITYANQASTKLLESRAHELSRVYPGFDPSKLIGSCIDMFHANPAHQRRLLADPANLPWSSDIVVGSLTFSINVRGVYDLAGNQVGCSLEWDDVTDQRRAQSEVESLLAGAVAGDLSTRIDAEQFDGFMRDLCSGINGLVEAVVKPLDAIGEVAASLAAGDLTQTMDGHFQGQFGDVQSALNGSVQTLMEMVEKINDTAAELSTEASTISEGNAELNDRTQEQAASLEETASAVEEMTSTTRQNADNAQKASKLSEEASTLANKGGEVVGRAVQAMESINGASKKIADIIGVIDEIAFQTNILALNAAVEAARAGEQGRGFAVVASEVRNLAQRSAGAAKEIKGLISDSVEKVAEGSNLVNETGPTLGEIVNSVSLVSSIVADIAAASEEQSSGVESINQAVMKMDEMTQKNAALVEEAAATSSAMDTKARGLSDLMTYFNVRGEEHEAEEPELPRKPARSRARERRAPAPAPVKRRSSSKPDGGWSEF